MSSKMEFLIKLSAEFLLTILNRTYSFYFIFEVILILSFPAIVVIFAYHKYHHFGKIQIFFSFIKALYSFSKN